MGRRVLLKEAAQLTGLSEWELSSGARAGRWPVLRIGSGRGKYIFDIDLIEARIQELMLSNIKQEAAQDNGYGQIRAIR